MTTDNKSEPINPRRPEYEALRKEYKLECDRSDQLEDLYIASEAKVKDLREALSHTVDDRREKIHKIQSLESKLSAQAAVIDAAEVLAHYKFGTTFNNHEGYKAHEVFLDAISSLRKETAKEEGSK